MLLAGYGGHGGRMLANYSDRCLFVGSTICHPCMMLVVGRAAMLTLDSIRVPIAFSPGTVGR